jgi:predicted transcriptional regulator
MRIEGNIKKSGRWWAVDIPMLLIYTQGRTKKEAYEMVEDAVEGLVDESGFKVDIHAGASTFFVKSNNDALLLGTALRQQRAHRGLSVRDVAQKMGSSSPTAYSRYEKGKTKPSFEKFSQLLKAIDESLEPVLTLA